MSLEDYPLVSDWLATDGQRLTVRTGKVDIGQRISSALTRIAEEELALAPDLISVASVRTGDSPDEGMTSGSNSIVQSGNAVRHAAATLRALALGWAAAEAGGDPVEWSLEDGHLRRAGTNTALPLLRVIAGRDLGLPVNPAAAFRDTGPMPPVPMRGISDMVTGRFRYVHDTALPDMLHARTVHPPHALARLRDIDPGTLARLTAEGIEIVRDGSFLAVAGPREWPVVKAALRLAAACDWDIGAGLDETPVHDRLTTANALRLTVENGKPQDGPLPDPLADPSHSARYERPFTMHGALAPSAAVALWQDGRLELSTQSQGVYPLRGSIAESLYLPLEQVVLTHAPGSGCYGHNGADDAAYEAALVARALPGRPILLKWTREDEHAWEPFGTAMAMELAAETDATGITAYSADVIGGTFRGRPRAGAPGEGPAKLLANRFLADSVPPRSPKPNRNQQGGLQRNLDPAYAFGRTRLVKNLVTGLPHRTSALRCLGAAGNVFALESFMDEIAHDRGEDAFAFRLRHLEDDRAIAVLERLRDSLDAPRAAGRGIAYARYKNGMARVAAAVDLDVTDRAEVRLIHATLVGDAGRVIDPDGVTAQLEGGFLHAASWALCEEVTWDRDGITSRDWDGYPVLRFDNVPTIETILIDRHDQPSEGVGEASSGPAIAAIANAIFAASGLRLRRIPFTAARIAEEAMR